MGGNGFPRNCKKCSPPIQNYWLGCLRKINSPEINYERWRWTQIPWINVRRTWLRSATYWFWLLANEHRSSRFDELVVISGLRKFSIWKLALVRALGSKVKVPRGYFGGKLGVLERAKRHGWELKKNDCIQEQSVGANRWHAWAGRNRAWRAWSDGRTSSQKKTHRET